MKFCLDQENVVFINGSICDQILVKKIFISHKIDKVVHFAAESHVDRSIDGPSEFIQTNIVGTYNLLEVSRSFWSQLDENEKKQFRFHHISTDEVFGSLGSQGAFKETTLIELNHVYTDIKRPLFLQCRGELNVLHALKPLYRTRTSTGK